MPPSRQEIKAAMQPPTPAPIPIEYLRQAAVDSEKLMGTPEWDSFQRRLQAMQDDYHAQYETWREKLEYASTPEDVKACQINVAQYKACMQLLGQVIALPKEIITHAHA